jgi:hypothetical protein
MRVVPKSLPWLLIRQQIRFLIPSVIFCRRREQRSTAYLLRQVWPSAAAAAAAAKT